MGAVLILVCPGDLSRAPTRLMRRAQLSSLITANQGNGGSLMKKVMQRQLELH